MKTTQLAVISCQDRLVRLAYLDESFSRDAYYLAAVVIDDRCALPLEEALDRVVTEAVDNLPGVSPESELHGHALLQGKTPWQDTPPRARIAIYDKAMRAIGEHHTQIFLQGVDCGRLRARYRNPWEPHDIVLQYMLERLSEFGAHHQEPVLVIADELHEHQRRRLRADLRVFKQDGTPGYASSQLPFILDTLHFAPSHHSRFIQAADLVAFLHHRRQRGPESDPRAQAVNDLLWSRVEPCIAHQRFWRP